MVLKQQFLKIAKSALMPTGGTMQRIVLGFDAQLEEAEQLWRTFCEFAGAAAEWLFWQTIFPMGNSFSNKDDVQLLLEAHLSFPFRLRRGGARFNNLVWFFIIASAMQLEVISDCGTFRGGNAWGICTSNSGDKNSQFRPKLF